MQTYRKKKGYVGQIILLIIGIITIIVGYYIVDDAKGSYYGLGEYINRSQIRDGETVEMIGAIITVIAVILIIVRAVKNSNIDNVVDDNFVTCQGCGTRVPLGTRYCTGCGKDVSQGLMKLSNDVYKESVSKAGGWECVECGKLNHSYVGTCGCGNTLRMNATKKENIRKIVAATNGNVNSNAEKTALDKLTELKKMFDMELITNEEYEEKRKQIIDKM